MPKPNKKTRRKSKTSSNARRRRRRSKDACGISFETLEDRKLLAGITVSTAADLSDGNTSSIVNLIADPGSDGAISLREAITAAENTSGLDTITFAPATFNGEAADVINLGATLSITDTIAIDAGDLDVVISGDSSQDDRLISGTFITDVQNNFFDSDNVRVFEISTSAQSVVTLSGLTITGGKVSFGDGGGILSNGASLVIEDSNVSGNLADSGGGIFADTGSVTISDSLISANGSDSFFPFVEGGGGISAVTTDVTITDSLVTRNFSSSRGGGISVASGNVTIINSTLSENTAVYSGGGISSSSGAVVITGSTINDNTARDFGGGGISKDTGTLDISKSTISGNTSSRTGSGIEIFGGALTITDVTITRNNTSFFNGAAIWADDAFGSVQPSLTVRNSIVAGNNESFIFNTDLNLDRNVILEISSSLIGSNLTGDFVNPLTPAPIGSPDADGNIIGTQSDPIDPMLLDLADNGGPTQTHALFAASPAIDAGSSLSTTDQRGEIRPIDQTSIPNSTVGEGSDIGAFEFQSLILTVDSSIDLVDGDFSAGNLSLREAINLTNDNPGADAILFSPNVFDGQADSIIRLQLGELQITEAVDIIAVDSNVVISADTLGNDIVDPVTFITDIEASDLPGALLDNNSRVFSIATTVGEDVTFVGLTITGANAIGAGGGITVSSANLELVDTSVSGNRSSDNGGGVYTDQNLTLTDSTISGNSADNGGGGGGIATTFGNLTLNNSTVSNNRATGSGGGGIRALGGNVFLNDSDVSGNTIVGSVDGGGISTSSGDVLLNGSTISGNQSDFQGGGISTASGDINADQSTISGNDAFIAGGGIWTGSGTVSLTNSILSGNATTVISNGVGITSAGGGGGIFAATGSVSIDQSTVSGNSTIDDHFNGGAIRTDSANVSITFSTISENNTFGDESEGGAISTNSGDVIVDSSTFSGNSTYGEASSGGAIATNSGTVIATSTTLSGNSTLGFDANGGAIATDAGEVIITSSTITRNSTNLNFNFGGFGGGVFIASSSLAESLTIQNSIIASNSAIFGNDLMINSSSIAAQSSLIGSNAGTLLTATSVPDANGNLIGSNTAIIDPMLDVLSDNGGVTLTHALLAGSPAIDAGSSALVTDQRSAPFVRTFGNAADIGAIEFQVLTLLVDTDSDVVNGDYSSRNLSLREAIDLANANNGEDFIRFSPTQFRGSTFDAIHLTQGELTITESVDIDGEEHRVVVTGDRNRDDRNFSGTAITDLANNSEFRLDDNSGVFNITAGTGEVVTLNGLIITGGIGSDGGGIRSETADVVIERSTIAGNRVSGNGGAIYNRSGLVTISNSTISGNETIGANASGGGIYFRSNRLSLANSTVSGNRATGINANGGGIATSSGDFNLNSATITNNSATGDGGGIFVDNSTDHPHLAVNNTIIAGNNSASSPDLKFDSSQTYDINFSLIGDNSGTPFVAAALGSPDANGNLIGTSTAVIDPLLDSLADVGGLTFTHQPQVGSPVINAGGSSTLTTDQRNIPLLVRDDGGGVDIGAFERHEFFLVVDNSSDVDDGNYTSGNLSLREALSFSNANPATDTITFDASVFNQRPSDVIRLQLGELVISDGVVIDAQGAGVIISGDTDGNDELVAGSFITDTFASAANDTLGDNSVRVIDITAAAGEVVSITGITITGGSTTDAFDDGGGIRNEDADVMLTDATIVGNRSNRSGDGGGIYSDDGLVFLQNSIVEANYSDSEGGGIYSRLGEVVLTNSAVIGNLSDFRGGGIYASGADVTLSNSVVNANIAERGDGGGIYTSSGDVTLNNSSLSENSADGDGGGVTTGSGDLTIDRSTISGNQSGGTGGGIDTFSGDITLRNTTISENQSGTLGGGIYTRVTDFTNILSSTIYNNQSEDDGGGIYHGSTSSSDVIVIENSIVAGNATANGTGPDLFLTSGVSTTTRTSLIGINAGTRLTATAPGIPNSTGSLIGSLESPVDPLLGNLADNGGPTLTHALLAGSPAINAGGSVGVSIGTTDQRGEARIVDGQVDIGAYEFDSAFLLGDVNQNRVVNFLDIFPFIDVLSSNAFQAEADINLDGTVNFLDINHFITLLSSQGTAGTNAQLSAASPEPAIGTSSADLFDAHPELIEEFTDFELDEIFEDLLI